MDDRRHGRPDDRATRMTPPGHRTARSRPDDLPATIPLVVRRAAARFGDRDALVDGERPLDVLVARGRGRDRRKCLRRHRPRAGRPRRHLGAERGEWAIAALGVYAAGARGRAAQHPLQGQRGRVRAAEPRARACCSPSPTSSTPTTSRSSTASSRRSTRSSTPSCCAARARRRDRRGTSSLGARRARSPPRRSRRAVAASGPRRPLRHPLHVGHHRHAQGRHAHPRGEHPRVLDAGPTSSACARAIATSSSTRSSTRSGSRPASSPRS